MKHEQVISATICPATVFSKKVFQKIAYSRTSTKNVLLPEKPQIVIEASGTKIYRKPTKVLTLFDFM